MTTSKMWQSCTTAKVLYMLQTDRISSLLDHEIDINAKDRHGRMALHLATAKNKTDVVSLLLDHNHDVLTTGSIWMDSVE